jgi:xanthine dehydrogenase accessory factor
MMLGSLDTQAALPKSFAVETGISNRQAPMRELLTEVTAALNERRECVHCSLVETRGSTPQKAGAAMLVFPDGSQRGTLGGGCVEAEVKQRALSVLTRGSDQPELLTFNLDDDYGWDDGLICGGRMTIAAEPLTLRRKGVADYFSRLRALVESGQGCIEAVVIAHQDSGPSPGSRYLFDAQGQLVAQLANGATAAGVAENLVPLERRPGPSVRHGIAYLPVLPRITLLIVGGGHVGQAVAKLAAEVDFDVWVLDDRERYASRERFPMASRLMVGDIGETLKQLAAEVTPSIYGLVVTRGHAHDEEALYHLAPTRAGYVGMIGSKRKIKLIYDDLLAKGITEEQLARVHAPLGFDIGSQTVPEIAVSIVAELIACRNKGGTIPAARIHVSPRAARA